MKRQPSLDDYAILHFIGYSQGKKLLEYWQTYGGHGHVQRLTGQPINTLGKLCNGVFRSIK